MFPKTIGDIEVITNLKVLNKTVIFAVCPNPKCSALYNLNEMSVDRSGQHKPALCKKKIWGKKCSTELSFEKKSEGQKWFLSKHFPSFLHLNGSKHFLHKSNF